MIPPDLDPLTPITLRLRASTLHALRRAKSHSNARSMAGLADAILRRHLFEEPVGLDRLVKGANRLGAKK
jgi:hypothetical protein